MPNWCECELHITGEHEVRQVFVGLVTDPKEKDTYDILNRLYPTPWELVKTISPLQIVETQAEADEINKNHKVYSPDDVGAVKAITREDAERRIKEYGNTDWYEWNIAHWGTKWGERDAYLAIHDKDSTVFEFSTAWSPPVEGFLKISKDFPGLIFKLKFWESGMGYRGWVIIRRGKIVREAQYNYRGDRGG